MICIITLVSLLLRMEAVCFTETSVSTHNTIRCLNQENYELNIHKEWCLLGCYAVWLL
jgi:hypothetical protein